MNSEFGLKRSNFFLILCGFGLLSNLSIVQAQENKPHRFQIKKYHVKKVDKTVWDPKTASVHMKGDVQIAMLLRDQTTAYLYCDEAIDRRAQEQGDCWDRVGRGLDSHSKEQYADDDARIPTTLARARFVWQELEVTAEHAFWDLAKRENAFNKNGFLTHKDFMKGVLRMRFDHSKAIMDKDDKIQFQAFGAKGVWTPQE